MLPERSNIGLRSLPPRHALSTRRTIFSPFLYGGVAIGGVAVVVVVVVVGGAGVGVATVVVDDDSVVVVL